MSRAILHTTLRQHIDFDAPPDHVADQLRQLADTQTTVQLSADDGEHMTVSIVRQKTARDSIRISGDLLRWGGTGTRLRYRAVTDVPAPSRNGLRAVVFLLMLIFAGITGWFLFVGLPQSVSYLGGRAIIGLFMFWLCLNILFAWITYGALVRDWASTRRWQAQQEMGEMVETLHSLRLTTTDAQDAHHDQSNEAYSLHNEQARQ